MDDLIDFLVDMQRDAKEVTSQLEELENLQKSGAEDLSSIRVIRKPMLFRTAEEAIEAEENPDSVIVNHILRKITG